MMFETVRGDMICRNCGAALDGKYDDNYNSDGSEIQCTRCEHWNSFTEVGMEDGI